MALLSSSPRKIEMVLKLKCIFLLKNILDEGRISGGAEYPKQFNDDSRLKNLLHRANGRIRELWPNMLALIPMDQQDPYDILNAAYATLLFNGNWQQPTWCSAIWKTKSEAII